MTTLEHDKWINLGDVSPAQGAILMRNSEISGGDFSAGAIDTINESTVGGDESVVLSRAGDVFLSANSMKPALASIGMAFSGTTVSKINHDGENESFDISSDEGRIALFLAAYAYNGMEVDHQFVCKIGKPQSYDQDPKFTEEEYGEIVQVNSNANLWNVMRAHLDGFDYKPPKVKATEEESASPEM